MVFDDKKDHITLYLEFTVYLFQMIKIIIFEQLKNLQYMQYSFFF